MAPLLQIVSRFKPSIDGMGDYARSLGMALLAQHHLPSHFLVFRQPQSPFDPLPVQSELAPSTLFYPTQPTPASLASTISQLDTSNFPCVLLHYGPYAYSTTGSPHSFIKAIETLAERLPLLVFFHELIANGPPWKRAFWTRREQTQSVQTLLRLARVAFTSNQSYRQRLEHLNPQRRPILTLPIFSNIGEPQPLSPIRQRARQLVLFGQLPTRLRLYQHHLPALEQVCRQLNIGCILDIGSGLSPAIPHQIAGIPVTSRGFLPDHDLSQLLQSSVAGILGYWPDVWEKSGVMASYQAHGLLPILVELEPRKLPKPAILPYLTPADLASLPKENGAVTDATLQSLVNQALEYYRSHQSLAHAAKTIFTYTSS